MGTLREYQFVSGPETPTSPTESQFAVDKIPMLDQATTPSNPPSGQHSLFYDSVAQKLSMLDSSGVKVSWGALNDLVVSTKTSAYTATSGDQCLLLDATSGAFTLSLYNPSGNAGRVLRLIKVDAGTNYVTLGGFNINGAARKLCTQYEELTIVSTGTSWITLTHTNYATGTYTPTLSNFSVSGTSALNAGRWVRRGGNMQLSLATHLGSTGSGTSGTITWSLPSGYSIDGTRLADTSLFSTIRNRIGSAFFYDNSAAAGVAVEVGAFNSTNLNLFKSTTTSAVVVTDIGANDQFGFTLEVPIVDWW